MHLKRPVEAASCIMNMPVDSKVLEKKRNFALLRAVRQLLKMHQLKVLFMHVASEYYKLFLNNYLSKTNSKNAYLVFMRSQINALDTCI